MSSDGNLRVAAIARYLRALGYDLTLTASPTNGSGAKLPKPRRRPPRRGEAAPAPTAADVPFAAAADSKAQWADWVTKLANLDIAWADTGANKTAVRLWLNHQHREPTKESNVHSLDEARFRRSARRVNERAYTASLRDRPRQLSRNG